MRKPLIFTMQAGNISSFLVPQLQEKTPGFFFWQYVKQECIAYSRTEVGLDLGTALKGMRKIDTQKSLMN